MFMEKEYRTILLIDDDQAVFSSVNSGLSKHYFSVFWERSPETTTVFRSIALRKPDLILLDILFDGEDEGKSILQELKKSRYKNIPVVIFTNTTKDLREEDYLLAISSYAKEGFSTGERAYDVFAEHLRDIIEGTSEIAPKDPRFGFVVGNTIIMQLVCRTILKVAPTDVSVLITGETGTGKELAAKALHNLSTRKEHKFVTVDCGAFPDDNLLISALFGHEKGAFTGANEKKMGIFEAADKGTVFLDEIGNATPQVQVKLLRAIQEKKIARLGSTASLPVDVRIIAATNKDLQHEVATGRFREDLFYRLSVVEIVLPPLRDRESKDIECFFQFFVRKFAEKHKKIITNILNEELLAKFRGYYWPGNIREFENMIERAVINSRGNVLLPSDFEFLKRRDVDESTNSIVGKIIAGEYDWMYVKGSCKGTLRRRVILEVCRNLKERDGQWPTGDELAKVFKTGWGNMRQILKDAGISLKELKKT